MSIQWRTDLEIGFDEVDSQHKELFRRVDMLVDACNKGKGRHEVVDLMKYLEEYIDLHFTAEENLQKKYGYPDYEKHKRQHQDFTFEFRALKDKLDNVGNTTDFVVLINRILVEWLVFHISRSDKDIALFIKSNC
ncbi:MAG: bacteriohemerythrin [Bacillota bacterium]